MAVSYDAAIAYDDPNYTYEGHVAGSEPFVLVRLTTTTPKILVLVSPVTGGMVGFRRSEGWEIVSKRFLMAGGNRKATVASAQATFVANRDAPLGTLKAALNSKMAELGHGAPEDTPAPNAS